MSDLVEKIWSAIQRPSPSVTREEIAALVLEDGNAKMQAISFVIDEEACKALSNYVPTPGAARRWDTCLPYSALTNQSVQVPSDWEYDMLTDCYHPKGHECKFCGHDKRKD
ncbi:MAG TPA: hypothetical protein VI358_18125 [Pseudolabrys sp.]